MNKNKENITFHEHKHDGTIIFVCFVGSAIVGYLLSTHFALFHF